MGMLRVAGGSETRHGLGSVFGLLWGIGFSLVYLVLFWFCSFVVCEE